MLPVPTREPDRAHEIVMFVRFSCAIGVMPAVGDSDSEARQFSKKGLGIKKTRCDLEPPLLEEKLGRGDNVTFWDSVTTPNVHFVAAVNRHADQPTPQPRSPKLIKHRTANHGPVHNKM
jgi:hypothetical protein